MPETNRSQPENFRRPSEVFPIYLYISKIDTKNVGHGSDKPWMVTSLYPGQTTLQLKFQGKAEAWLAAASQLRAFAANLEFEATSEEPHDAPRAAQPER